MIQTQITNTLSIGDGSLVLIGGPCVIESLDFTLKMAEQISIVCERLGISFIFKSSLIKPTAPQSFLRANCRNWTEKSSSASKMKLCAGAHRYSRELPSLVAPVVDVLQIPAFCVANRLTPWQQQLQVELSMLKKVVPRSLGHEACCPQAGIRRNQTDF